MPEPITLTALGIAAGWHFVFKPILDELVKDTAKDFAKDFCKGALKSVLLGKDEWAKAAAKTLKEFLEQFEQELVGAGETEQSVGAYTKSLGRFTKEVAVREALGLAITEPGTQTDAGMLARAWTEQKLERLPDDFDWPKLCRRFQNRVRAIIRDSTELRDLLDSHYQQATAEAAQRSAGLAPGFDTSNYADGLRKRYGYLKLESLDPSPDHERIALTKIFVEQTVRSCQQFNPRVYELPVERRRQLRKRGALEREFEERELERQREAFRQQTPSLVLEAVNDPRRRLCVVLGDPGSGKSVLLEYLAVRWAECPPVERASVALPLIVELKTYAENLGKGICRNFLEFLDHGIGTLVQLDQKELDSLLKRGDAMMLLDGLDEIFDPPTRQQVAQELVGFSIKYPSARFVVTSRVIGYDLVAPILRDADFQHFLLQDLEEPQQERFIVRWHELAYADLIDRLAKSGRLRDSIANVAAIRELAQNPLLLTLMALLNRHQELPQDRNDLYEQASKLMLQQWDASKALRDDPLLAQQSFDYKNKQAMLRSVAFRMQTSPHGLAGNVIAADDLEQTLVNYLQGQNYPHARPIAARLIHQLRERNFILCLLGDDFFAFVHRTFLEFFCAWAWVWKFEKERELDLEGLQRETFDARWRDERWHEVLRLIAARLEPQFSRKLIEGLLGRRELLARYTSAFLAANCFADIRNRASLGPLGEELEKELKALAQHSGGPFDTGQEEDENIAKAVRAIALCWPKALATKTWLARCIASSGGLVMRQAAVQELARGWKLDPDTLPLLKGLARSDEDSGVRYVAVQELARGWKSDPETLPLLKALARSDEDSGLRQAAVQELARGWKEDPETVPLLKHLARSDEPPIVRRAAVRELARGWREDPETLVLLKTLARSDEDGSLRQGAAQELARGWKEDPETLVLLKTLARNDERPIVRKAAMQELAQGWKEDPETLTLLRSLIESDERLMLRRAAVQELAQGWKEYPETLALLQGLARSDRLPLVRRVAVEELARGWKEDSETLRLLNDIACSDGDYPARRAAVHELAQGWKHDPEILPLLKDLARNDDNSRLRQCAVHELAQAWKEDPETLALIKDLVRADDDSGLRQAAVHELARGWGEDPETLPLLKALARSAEESGLRQAAMQELARGWREDPDTVPMLKGLAGGDDAGVRYAAALELAWGWKEDPETLPLLRAIAVGDRDPGVRQAAVRDLARGWRKDPETLLILQERANTDENSGVRRAAVRELVRDRRALPRLRDLACSHADAGVRRAVLRGLGLRRRRDAETLLMLKHLARGDEIVGVRRSAVRELMRGWKNDPGVVAFVRKLEGEDADLAS